jgi:hypothetical protein
MSLDEPCTCERCCRKAAFGAIRQAVKYIRHLEDEAEIGRKRGEPRLYVGADLQLITARNVVRLMIGSEKSWN